jgi:hypothetical protein
VAIMVAVAALIGLAVLIGGLVLVRRRVTFCLSVVAK